MVSELHDRIDSLLAKLDSIERQLQKGPTTSDMMVPGFHSQDPSTWRSQEQARKRKMEIENDLQTLAEELTKQIQANPVSLMLMEPLSLTVKKRDGQYSKRPHVGGENFKVESVYAGKRGKLIYVFKPQDAADYAVMEMDEAQAKKSLSGFDAYITSIVGSEFNRFKKEAMEAASLAAEREKLSERADQYADLGFGSW